MCAAENLPRFAQLYQDVDPLFLYLEKAKWDEDYRLEGAKYDAAMDRAFEEARAAIGEARAKAGLPPLR